MTKINQPVVNELPDRRIEIIWNGFYYYLTPEMAMRFAHALKFHATPICDRYSSGDGKDDI